MRSAKPLLAHASNVAIGLLRVRGACKRERGDGLEEGDLRSSDLLPAPASNGERSSVGAGSRNRRWAPLFPPTERAISTATLLSSVIGPSLKAKGRSENLPRRLLRRVNSARI
jgi:hypothetical protein